jgi:hypothetical protein
MSLLKKQNKASEEFFKKLGENAAKMGMDISQFPASMTSQIFGFFLDGWRKQKESILEKLKERDFDEI